MKKLLLLSLNAIFLTAGLVACSSSKTNTTFKNDKDIFSLQAVTGMSMLSSYEGTAHINKLIKRSNERSDFTEEQVTKIKEVLPTVDLLLDNETTFLSHVEEVNVEIDGKIYETKEEITFLNKDLSSSSYLLFYNIIEEKVEDDEEIEEKKDMEGIAYIDEETYYPFISKEEKEVEDDEVENTRKFMILTGEESYIEIKEEHSYESDEVEQKLHYEVVQDSQKIVDYKIKIENENQENEIKVEIGEMNFKVEREIFEDTYIYKISLKDDETNQMVTLKREILEDGNISYEIYE